MKFAMVHGTQDSCDRMHSPVARDLRKPNGGSYPGSGRESLRGESGDSRLPLLRCAAIISVLALLSWMILVLSVFIAYDVIVRILEVLS